jgi:carboxyl-terminal processing protease
MYWTVQGLVNSLKDEYTVFFPPTEAKDFNDELTAEYEWIWAYIEMIKPGELIIVSPISWSPAEKIGLKAGDRIIEINGNKIGESTDVQTVTSRIKWPEGSQVTIKILRDKKEFAFKVKRERITIKNVELKQLSWNICDVSIRMFGLWTANEFASIITQSQDKKCKKYIFDLRNNPWWSLDDVASILSYFVPDNKPVVIIKSTTENTIIHASPNTIKITDKPIMILINKGSASASEIFAGTIKEYGKKVTLLGEKSFWKWSVQQLVEYSDWSILKYTIAKRYTGKLQKNIDKNWIDPDIKITDNPETKADEILEYAKKKLLSNQ